jgi:hypothetical protein
VSGYILNDTAEEIEKNERRRWYRFNGAKTFFNESQFPSSDASAVNAELLATSIKGIPSSRSEGYITFVVPMSLGSQKVS